MDISNGKTGGRPDNQSCMIPDLPTEATVETYSTSPAGAIF